MIPPEQLSAWGDETVFCAHLAHLMKGGGTRGQGRGLISEPGFCLGPSRQHSTPHSLVTLHAGEQRPGKHYSSGEAALGEGATHIHKEEGSLLPVQAPVSNQLLQAALQLQALRMALAPGPQSRQRYMTLPWLQ